MTNSCIVGHLKNTKVLHTRYPRRYLVFEALDMVVYRQRSAHPGVLPQRHAQDFFG